jgi:hypothetical protein
MKITLTIECHEIDPKSKLASGVLDQIETGWQQADIPWSLIDAWWFEVEGGESRYMPEEEPDQSRDTFVPHPDDAELNLLLMRLWINKPIIDHGLLLYSESVAEARKRLPNYASLEHSSIREVRQELNELYRLAAKRLNLTRFDA